MERMKKPELNSGACRLFHAPTSGTICTYARRWPAASVATLWARPSAGPTSLGSPWPPGSRGCGRATRGSRPAGMSCRSSACWWTWRTACPTLIPGWPSLGERGFAKDSAMPFQNFNWFRNDLISGNGCDADFEYDANVKADGEFVVELGSSTGRFHIGVEFHQGGRQCRLTDRVSQ